MDGLVSVFRSLEEEILGLFYIFLKNTAGTRRYSGNLYFLRKESGFD